MNTIEEPLQRIERLEKTIGLLLEALEGSVSDQKLEEVRECLNPSPKLSQSQQEVIDVALLKAYYGDTRYEAEFADLDAGEKALARWKVYG